MDTGEIALPEGLDPAIAANLLRQAAEKADMERREKAIIDEVLVSDDALARLEVVLEKSFVRASVYGKGNVRDHQEILPYRYRHDERRPVLMKGTKEYLVRRHANGYSTTGNGLGEELAERYLRFIKWTSFSFEENYKKLTDLEHAIASKIYTTHHFSLHRDHNLNRADNMAWVRGKRFECGAADPSGRP